MTAVGVTGHQSMPPEAVEFAERQLEQFLAAQPGPLVGLSCLAAGSDQLFARAVLNAGGSLIGVIPSKGYESTFDGAARATYVELLGRCTEVIALEYDHPAEEAFMAGGEEVARRCDVLVAVWDGCPAAGLGGTADAVAFARSLGKQVVVMWPEGVRR